MKFTRNVLAAAVLAATASMSAQAITVDSVNHTGQLLLAPVYAAGPGQSTEIRVVNPDLRRAIKAHVTFRSAVSSLDLLNFLIYLSPGDEWIGTVSHNAETNLPQIYSTDDSLLVSTLPAGQTPTTGVFASPAAPVTMDFFNKRLRKSDGTLNNEDAFMGHVEVLGVYVIDDGVATDVDGSDTRMNRDGSGNRYDLIRMGMSKEILFDIDRQPYNGQRFTVGGVDKGGLYDSYVPVPAIDIDGNNIADMFVESDGNLANFNDVSYPYTVTDLVALNLTGGANTVDMNNAGAANAAIGLPVANLCNPGAVRHVDGGFKVVAEVFDDPNTPLDDATRETYCLSTTDVSIQLMGDVTIKLADNTAPFSYYMTALDDDLAGGVIENPYFDVVAENDVPLGVRMGAVTGATPNLYVATDNIIAINQAIAAYTGNTVTASYDSMEPHASMGDAAVSETGMAESMLVVTFPTKYRHVPSHDSLGTGLWQNLPLTDAARGPAALGTLGLAAVVPGTTVQNDFDDNGQPLPGTYLLSRGDILRTVQSDLLDDNLAATGGSRNTPDYDEDFVHYDYDYGYQQGFIEALAGYAISTAPYPSHDTDRINGGRDYIYGSWNFSCSQRTVNGQSTGRPFDGGNRLAVPFAIASYDTEENTAVAAAATVISGDIGTGGGNAFPNEVNLLTDSDAGLNSLWYSTKGWFTLNLTPAGANGPWCYTTAAAEITAPITPIAPAIVPTAIQVLPAARNAGAYAVPALVNVITTDTNGNSRILSAK
jgi:hypothetical protein